LTLQFFTAKAQVNQGMSDSDHLKSHSVMPLDFLPQTNKQLSSLIICKWKNQVIIARDNILNKIALSLAKNPKPHEVKVVGHLPIVHMTSKATF